MFQKRDLEDLYENQGLSVAQIAGKYRCSQNKVTYWFQKYGIKKRSISEAIYLLNNPDGDPFSFIPPQTAEDWFTYGLGIGLYWGEGNKVSKNAVRLGNTDPDLILRFLDFLTRIYRIKKSKLRFGLQLFNDISKKEALKYWTSKLHVSERQFQKVIMTRSRKNGTYRNKTTYGVLTVYFSNTKLRDSIMSAINGLRGKPL